MKKIAALSVGLALLCGCAVGPNYERPPVTPPVAYRDVIGPHQPAATLADQPWWDVFHDDTLRKLIDEALVTGYDAQIAAWRVEEARARAGIAKSEFFPQIFYGGQWSRSQQSTYTGPANHETVNLHSVNVNFNWELDLWGRIRRLNEAAKAQYLATDAARKGVLISLISDVASTYFRLRELDEELVISRKTADAFQQTARLFERKLSEGAASALESSYAAAAYKQVNATVPDIERQIEATENVLNVLLGRNPADVPRGITLADAPVVPEIPAGLPSDLLQRRPDIAQAEQELIAANAGVGVATANFFPTISLTGLFGGVSPDVSNLFTPGRTWSIAAGLFGPLFQGGRLRSEYDVAYAQWEQSKLFYEQTVTNAFNETTTVLYAKNKLAASVRELADSVGYYRDMVRLTNLRYNSGLSSYFEVLYSMQQLFPAEIALARARVNLLTNSVDIYKALGGGWNIANPTWQSPAAAPAPARPGGGDSEP
ncbi:MAG TPA: efflux transporter outer membrane subunit [Thermoanaerobaculia bacterium]|nr:efflux transporter outer membrane subunit [Thermoanaerobaculia bacterium]